MDAVPNVLINDRLVLPIAEFIFMSDFAYVYEIGLKDDLMDVRGQFGSALYLSERRDLVQSQRIDGVATQFNAGGFDVLGLEVNRSFEVFPGLKVSGNYTYTDFEWQQFVFGSNEFSGFEVIQTPNHLAAFPLIGWPKMAASKLAHQPLSFPLKLGPN